jgi:hypothetical protein
MLSVISATNRSSREKIFSFSKLVSLILHKPRKVQVLVFPLVLIQNSKSGGKGSVVTSNNILWQHSWIFFTLHIIKESSTKLAFFRVISNLVFPYPLQGHTWPWWSYGVHDTVHIWRGFQPALSVHYFQFFGLVFSWGGTTWTGDFKCREVKTGFCQNR